MMATQMPPMDVHAIKRLPHAHSTPNPTPVPRPDIFDTLTHWLDSPDLAYASWIARQRLRESTKIVYIAMFGRFCTWLKQQGKRLDQIGAGDIARFLDTANPNVPVSRRHAQTTRQRQQYVRQLERIYAHLGTLGYAGQNVGSQAGIERLGSGNDKPSRFLSPEESTAVVRLIQTRLDELRKAQAGKTSWMDYRDLAIVAMMMGGGLKVNHAQALTLNCIDMREEHIELSRPGCAHRARILAFAVAPIKAWLDIQAEMHGHVAKPDRKVFEADRSVGFGRTSKTVTLSASSIHRRTQRLLGMAGITGERACAQTLRNTYAGLLIAGGATDEHLVDYLGLHATVTAQRLRAAFAKSRAQWEAGDAEDADFNFATMEPS